MTQLVSGQRLRIDNYGNFRTKIFEKLHNEW